MKDPISVIRSGSNVIQRRQTANSRASSEMFLDLKEYENIRYPLNNPAAPNVHDILKPVISQQENGEEKISQKPKAGILFDSENDDYLDLSGPPAAKYDDFFRATSHTKFEGRLEHSRDDSSGSLAHSDGKISSSHSEGSVKVPYVEMALPKTLTKTIKSSTTVVTVHATGTQSTLLEGKTDQNSTDVVSTLIPTEQPTDSKSATELFVQEVAVSNIPETVQESLTVSEQHKLNYLKCVSTFNVSSDFIQ